MSLYTRTGDDGTTGLVGGGRTEKDSLTMHAVGDVDELNAAIGCIGDENLRELQSLLFEVGADIASPTSDASKRRITQQDIDSIEKWIDTLDKDNEQLKSFVLPGGCNSASSIHLARTICRRAERSVTTLHRSGGCSAEILVLLNRISDLLFAMARSMNRLASVQDIPWHPKGEDPT